MNTAAIIEHQGKVSPANNPMTGLLLYLWYYSGGKLIILNLQAIFWGVVFLILGNPFVHFLFGMNAIAGATFILISGMGNKEIDWERFQLSMPVRRNDMAASQYLSVVAASLVGIPIYLIFTGLSSILHQDVYFTLTSVITSIAPFLSIPYILGGLVFPLYSIPALDKLYEGMFPAAIVVSVAIPQLVVVVGNHLSWSILIASLLMLVVSALIFAGSYIIYRRLNAKMDF
jgi:hypothetical protein